MNTVELARLVLTILGGLVIADKGLKVLVALFPRVLTAQSKTWHFVADTIAIRAFRRRAIATGIEAVLNQTAFKLQRHLPTGWVRRVRIRWVRGSQTSQFSDGHIVLRIRPGKNPDHNFIQSLYTYFSSALFPDCRDILPDEIVSSVALAITRASLEGDREYLLGEFDNVFLRNFGEDHRAILDHFGDCVRLNEYGFLMGPFLREVDRVAKDARYSSMRAKIPEMIQQILDHMLAFQPLLRIDKPDDNWFYEGPCTSCGFILVSKPANIRPGIDAYVKRAKSRVQKGIQHLYVIGRYEEREFVYAVIDALLAIRELKGLETFPLFRDYRGDPNGIGALLGLDEMLGKLGLTLRSRDKVQVHSAGTPATDKISLAVTSTVGLGDESSLGLDTTAQRDLGEVAEDLIIQLSDYDGAWIPLAYFGAELRRQLPEFTPQHYGGRNLISVLRRLDCLEFDERGAGPAKSVYVRLLPPDQIRAQQAPARDEDEVYARTVRIIREHAQVDGWMFLGAVGNYLRDEFADFDHSEFGAPSLRDLIGRIPSLEMEERGLGHSKTYVRIRE